MSGETDKGDRGAIAATVPEMQDAVLVEAADHGTRGRKARRGRVKAETEGEEMSLPMSLGQKTRWGKVCAILWTEGERYYLFAKKSEVSLLPAAVVER